MAALNAPALGPITGAPAAQTETLSSWGTCVAAARGERPPASRQGAHRSRIDWSDACASGLRTTLANGDRQRTNAPLSRPVHTRLSGVTEARSDPACGSVKRDLGGDPSHFHPCSKVEMGGGKKTGWKWGVSKKGGNGVAV